MQLEVQCQTCKEIKTLEVEPEAFEKYKRGEGYVQKLFPHLSIDERELLISRTCGPCFDELCSHAS
jgi:hypothetical protein